ncbi:hypothetical protein [Actinokineospora enzanensis]|uniref:oxidoreductase n=1 Tax=Actinokineospora enzanensis TaxID=155975 RepID=UPI00037B731E|nr:hypothetical protein [Actinokineospora enzanensis]
MTTTLLSPLTLGDLTLPNRIVMAPLTRARATDGVPTERHATYYAQRATAGLIITEGTWVSERAIGFVGVPGLYSEAQVTGWRRVTDVVRAHGGRMIAQLWHSGAVSHPDLLGGTRPAGPSAIDPQEICHTPSGPRPTVTPREMTADDIRTAIDDYRTASANARRAGFAGVEIHALGTSLVPQFLNPRLNRRTDTYGTDRATLLLEIIAAAADPWDHGVGVRLAPWWSDGRFATDPAHHDDLVTELDRHPVAHLHLRGPGTPDPDVFTRHRRRFTGPLIVNHGFTRATADAALAAGTADAVSFGTPFIANPDLVSRLALDLPLAQGDPATYYTGGAAGYLDYPTAAAGIDWTSS